MSCFQEQSCVVAYPLNVLPTWGSQKLMLAVGMVRIFLDDMSVL